MQDLRKSDEPDFSSGASLPETVFGTCCEDVSSASSSWSLQLATPLFSLSPPSKTFLSKVVPSPSLALMAKLTGPKYRAGIQCDYNQVRNRKLITEWTMAYIWRTFCSSSHWRSTCAVVSFPACDACTSACSRHCTCETASGSQTSGLLWTERFARSLRHFWQRMQPFCR